MPDSSLRTPRRAPTRKATIAPPVPIPGQGPIPRGLPKSRVDDRIKKRMSMRYAEMVASPTEVSPVPPVPGLPPGVNGSDMMSFGMTMGMMDGDSGKSQRSVKNDKKILDDERFDPDAFLKIKLANSTEAELKSLQSSLRNSKEETNGELRKNVFKNYAEFVLVSKEITSLETEMLELKDLLSEYKSMPSLLHIPDPTANSHNANTLSAYKRSSVADLRIMYFNQMQELHSLIEGAAKFAPTTPGRHVVGELDGVYALNAATYKVMGRVRFVVLDDLVLVAKRRRRNAGGGGDGTAGGGTVNEGKLVAERYWPLNEMLVLDTKDSARMTNVFKIRHGKETHVYRTETAADKKALLSQFRQVADELAAKKRKEREGEHERRKSMWQSGGRDRNSIPPVPDWMADLAKKGGDIPGFGSEAKEKTERDSRWVNEWADDLNVAIALREWEKAVALVEQGKAKLSTTPLLAHKLPSLTSQLISALLKALSTPTTRKTGVVRLISLLTRLKAGAAARSTFLDMRTKVVKSHVRKIRFEGHVGAYVGDLAVVYFTGIKHTADWFLASFKENEVASSFIDWARTQIEDFAEIFRKQVFTSDIDQEAIEEAKSITVAQSKKLLQEYGLDFRFLLDELLVPKPKERPEPTRAFTFADYQHPKIEPVPASRRRFGAPPPPTITTDAPDSEQPLQRDHLAPPPSANGATPLLSAPLLTGASGYTSASYYSNTTTPALNTPALSARLGVSNNINGPESDSPPRSRTPVSASARPRTPVSARPRTPLSPTGPRTPASAALPLPQTRSPVPRTPVSAAPLSSTPFSASTLDVPLGSPVSRRQKTPPPSANGVNGVTSPMKSRARDWDRERERVLEEKERERLAGKGLKGSPAPPPRSSNRPNSTSGHRPPPVAVPTREGMI